MDRANHNAPREARPRKVTLADVASAAGVSIATVSSILGRAPGSFSPSTVERVQQAARELGFRPNALARWLRTGKPRLIGLVEAVDLDSAQHCIKHRFEVGIAREARKHGLDILKVLVAVDEENAPARICDLVESGLLDCLAVENPPAGSGLLDLLKERSAHFVVLGNPGRPDVCSVDTDNVALGAAAARHLVGLGHSRLGCIAPLPEWAWGNDRVLGFTDECVRLGVRDVKCVRRQHSKPGGYSGMQDLLSREPRVTAVFAADDPTAYGALEAVTGRGLAVPRDVSILGCNNDVTSSVEPDFLTSIELDFVALGEKLAAKAIALSEGRPVETREYQQFQLIARRSTGPAPG